MTKVVKPPRKLFGWTCLLLLGMSAGVFLSRPALPPSIQIETKGQPTIGYGKARVHVVIFEEPKCAHCRDFNTEIFPVIKNEFIDTNKIRYTLVPVSFLQGSMPAAIAALCIYNDNPLYPNDELFFKFFDYILHHQDKAQGDLELSETLLQYAKNTSPAIHLDKLKSCIDKESYRIQIEKNTAYGAQIMDGTIVTPTVFVNGIKVDELSLEKLKNLIGKVLEHEGVK